VVAEFAHARAGGDKPRKGFIGPFQQHSFPQRPAGADLMFQFLQEHLDVGGQLSAALSLRKARNSLNVPPVSTWVSIRPASRCQTKSLIGEANNSGLARSAALRAASDRTRSMFGKTRKNLAFPSILIW
jgi:hypothetical protein